MVCQPEVEKWRQSALGGNVKSLASAVFLKHFQAPIVRKLVRRMTFKGIVTTNVSIVSFSMLYGEEQGMKCVSKREHVLHGQVCPLAEHMYQL